MNRKDKYILVDYDNLPQSISRENSIKRICEEIIFSCSSELFKNSKLCFRLYGGWMRGKDKTDMSVLVQKKIGRSRNFTIIHDNINIPVTCDIAFGLIQGVTIPATYRTNRNIRKIFRTNKTCNKCQNCKVNDLFSVLKNERKICDEGYFHDFFYQNEQKLVDSMIVADLIEISHKSNTKDPNEGVFIVSSDDDMIPGVLIATNYLKVHLIDMNRDSFRYTSLFQRNNNFNRIGYKL